jgi:uncharacterized membrane protein
MKPDVAHDCSHPIYMRIWRASLLIQSLFYVAAGINHFWHPAFYRHVMPDHYAHPEGLVKLSGLAEILGGLGLLLPATRRASAAGIVLMLVVFLDVHQYMLRHPERFPEVPVWALWARVPLQFVLIAWAWSFTRKGDGPPALPGGALTPTTQDTL